MSFQLNFEVPVQESFRTISSELVENAIAECRNENLTDHVKIHEARKKCKRVRALLRIVKPNVKSKYKTADLFFRNLSGTLSDERDNQVIIETLKFLHEKEHSPILKKEIESIISKLSTTVNSKPTYPLVQNFEKEILLGNDILQSLKIKKSYFKSLRGGIKETYKLGRIGMKAVIKNPNINNYHEWRKQVKYHLYHLELLIDIWPSLILTNIEETHSLSEMLGKDHDLSLLKENIHNKNITFTKKAYTKILSAITSEQKLLREKIKRLGLKIYAEKQDHLIKRLESYWESNTN